MRTTPSERSTSTTFACIGIFFGIAATFLIVLGTATLGYAAYQLVTNILQGHP